MAKDPIDILIDVAYNPVIALYIRSITLVRGVGDRYSGDLRTNAGQKLVEHQVPEKLRHENGEYDWASTRHLCADRAGFCASLGVLLTHVTGLRHLEFDSADTAVMAMSSKLHETQGRKVCVLSHCCKVRRT